VYVVVLVLTIPQIQLPQSVLYDLFSSIDGSESTYKELFGHGLDHSRLMVDSRGNIVSWNPGNKNNISIPCPKYHTTPHT
jgi:hypothetical protein